MYIRGFDKVTLKTTVSLYGNADGKDINEVDFNNSPPSLVSVYVNGIEDDKAVNLGYMELLICDTNSLSSDIEHSEIEIADIIKLGEDMLEQGTFVILKRIYVSKKFRRLGISTWLQTNMTSIIKAYYGFNIKLVLLKVGDFTHESDINKNYISVLCKYYSNLGYKKINKIIKYRLRLCCSNILYKYVDN